MSGQGCLCRSTDETPAAIGQAQAVRAGRVVLLCVALGLVSCTGPTTPPLVVTESTFDWGCVLEGDIVTFSTMLTNTTNSDITIDRVSADCSCMIAAAPERIRAGSSEALEVEVDTFRKTGYSVRTLVVHAASPHQQEVVLTLSGEVTPIVLLDPAIPEISGLAGESRVLVLDVQPVADDALKLDPPEEMPSGAQLSIRHVPGAESPFQLDLTATIPDGFPGQTVTIGFDLTAALSNGDTRRVHVPLHLTVRDPVTIAPARRLVFTRSTIVEAKDRELTIEVGCASTSATLEIKSLRLERDQDSVFSVSMSQVSQDKATVTVRLTDSPQSMTFRDTLHIDVSEPVPQTRKVDLVVLCGSDLTVPTAVGNERDRFRQ